MKRLSQFLTTMAIVGVGLAPALPALAVAYSSTNYQVIDPTFSTGTEITGSSTTWRLIGTLGETVTGRTTGTTFTLTSGSLTYPRCTSPTLTGVPANGAANLTWTAATCQGGWTLTGYEVCSGSAVDTYSACSNVGNVLTSSRSATPSVAVFYRVRAVATGAASSGSPAGNVGSRSSELQITASGGSSGGGGGGGGSVSVTTTSVTLPNGGEKLVSGSNYNVTWTSTGTGVSTIRIKLSGDGGFSFPTTVVSGEANDGNYLWPVPALTGAQFRLMIEGLNTTGDVVISDMSNSNFAIGPAGAVPEPVAGAEPPPTVTPLRASPSPVSDVSVRLSGTAFSGGTVTVLRDGTRVGTATADASGSWTFTMPNLTPGGTYTFTFSATSAAGQQSSTSTRTVTLPSNTPLFELTNLFPPPTLVASKTSVQPGEEIKFSGSAASGTSVTLEFHDFSRVLAVGVNGLWETFRSTKGLVAGTYSLRGRVGLGTEVSAWSPALSYTVGGAAVSTPAFRNADINGDGRVNLTDFSRLVAQWNKAVPPAPAAVDLNIDTQVNLKDLSIMLNKWTG